MIWPNSRKKRRRNLHRELAWRAELASRPKRSVMELLKERAEKVRRDMDAISGVCALMKMQPELPHGPPMTAMEANMWYLWKTHAVGFSVMEEGQDSGMV